MYDVIIIGSGIAGMTAAIYAQRAGLEHLLIEKEAVPGGQIIKAYEIDNYPGLQKISGADLALSLQKQCKDLGVKTLRGEAERVEACKAESHAYNVILSDGSLYSTANVVLAVGAKPRLLGIEGEEKFAGRGISYCATCDGFFYKGKKTVVIGGGDTALKSALYLSNVASEVYLIHRRSEFRGSYSTLEKVKQCKNITLVTDSVPVSLVGEDSVEGIWIKKTDASQESSFIECEGIFAAIGNVPLTDKFSDIVDLDSQGYILAGEDCRTSAQGIFAVGDCRSGRLKQLITAASDGAVAVSQIKGRKNS